MCFEEQSESSKYISEDSNWKLIKTQVGISPYERSNHTCVVVKVEDEENLFVYGGHDENGNTLNDLLIYNNRLGWSYASANKIVSTVNKVVVVEHGFSYHPPAPLELSAIPPGRSFHTSVVYHNFMIVFGGNPTEIDGQVYFLDFSQNARLTWCVFTSPNAPPEVKTQRFQHTAVIWNNNMVIFGGTNGETPLPSCVLFLDLVKFKWKVKKQEKLKPTFGHAAFVKDNLMYIVGGSNPVLNNGFSIYALDADQVLMNGSDFLPYNINIDRRLLTATVIDDFLYLIGGYSVTKDGAEMGCANQIDIIDLKRKKWISRYPNGTSPESICGHTAVYFDGTLTVFGGCDRLPLLDGKWVFCGVTSNLWQFKILSNEEFEFLSQKESIVHE